MKEKYEIEKRLHDAIAGLNFSLVCFGDHIAKREKYKEVDGIDAVHFYLIHKHHWTPSQVRSMSYDDLRFALTEEMHGWTLPKEARA